MIYRFALTQWSIQVNVLLKKCIQNTTSLSLLAGRTVAGANIRPICILLSVDKLFQGLNIQKKKLKHGGYHDIFIFLTTVRYTRISDNTSLNLGVDFLSSLDKTIVHLKVL